MIVGFLSLCFVNNLIVACVDGTLGQDCSQTALITVAITLVMLCLVYVCLVVERVGWGHTVNSVSY